MLNGNICVELKDYTKRQLSFCQKTDYCKDIIVNTNTNIASLHIYHSHLVLIHS